VLFNTPPVKLFGGFQNHTLTFSIKCEAPWNRLNHTEHLYYKFGVERVELRSRVVLVCAKRFQDHLHMTNSRQTFRPSSTPQLLMSSTYGRRSIIYRQIVLSFWFLIGALWLSSSSATTFENITLVDCFRFVLL